jgi:RNA polymerase sigma-70 factor (ECF subfamily)
MAVRAELLQDRPGQADPRLPFGLAALYEQYGSRLERLCRQRLGAGGDAEDAVHETLLKAWGARERFEAGRPMWPWLATIARNTCTDMQRRHHLACTRGPLPDAGSSDPQDRAPGLDRDNVVRRALVRLSSDDRDLLVLRDIEGWGYADIARRQHRSPGAVRMAVARARRQLRGHVEELARSSGQWPLAGLTGGLLVRARGRAADLGARGRGVTASWLDVATGARLAALAPLAITGLLTVAEPTPPARPAAPVYAEAPADHASTPAAETSSPVARPSNEPMEVPIGPGHPARPAAVAPVSLPALDPAIAPAVDVRVPTVAVPAAPSLPTLPLVDLSVLAIQPPPG